MRESIRGFEMRVLLAEGRSVDRSLVQVKHNRSRIDVGCKIKVTAELAAQNNAPRWFAVRLDTCGTQDRSACETEGGPHASNQDRRSSYR